jgi:hypothetical protein
VQFCSGEQCTHVPVHNGLRMGMLLVCWLDIRLDQIALFSISLI